MTRPVDTSSFVSTCCKLGTPSWHDRLECDSIGILGVLLMLAGLVVLVLRGVSYAKDKEEGDIGPIEIEAEEKDSLRRRRGSSRSPLARWCLRGEAG